MSGWQTNTHKLLALGASSSPAIIRIPKCHHLTTSLPHPRLLVVVSTSEYEFPPNPWRLFTAVGGLVESDEDLVALGGGAAVYLFTGGQFIWPGVRIGHTIPVNVPVVGGHKVVTLTTVSLRPMALVLSDFLSEEECEFIKSYAASRMVPSGLAVMDSTAGSQEDVRTSTQTFMERNGSPQIRSVWAVRLTPSLPPPASAFIFPIRC